MSFAFWLFVSVVGALIMLIFGIRIVYDIRRRQRRVKQGAFEKMLEKARTESYSDGYKSDERARRRLEERIEQLERFIRENKLYAPPRIY